MPNACVIGHPVAHSLSPKLHSYWLAQYGIKGSYDAQDVAPENLAAFIRNLPEHYVGCNVTLPHKAAVIPFLDETDEMAKAIGAVNTIIVTPGRKLIGINTDAFGFMQNIKSGSAQEGAKNKAVVLGAGGAACAVVSALQSEGYKQIVITNRTRDKAEALNKRLGGNLTIQDWQERGSALSGADLLVNTTSLGLKNGVPLEIDLALLPSHAVVNDIVYNPLITGLLKAAKAKGNTTIDGLGMLLWQAVPAFEAWFGRRPEVTAALREHVLA